MKDRIRQLMESQNMTQQNFANYIGMAPATLSSIFNERTRPTLQTVEAIKTRFPRLSLDWLLYGIGEMYMPSTAESSEASASDSPSMEPMLDFAPHDSASGSAEYHPSAGSRPASIVAKSAAQPEVVKEYVKRNITEIRVYFDDLTYETFVPDDK